MSISLPITSGTIGNLTQLTVDARALHQALEVRRDFSSWIKARIAKYDFIEGEDYEKSSMITNSPIRGSQAAIEYRLSVNMGKELAMVENNERGKLVRRYFIECERRLMETPAPAIPPLSTVESRRTLNTLVRQWAALSGLSYPDCWAEVHVAFDVETVADLPNNKVKEAERWVQAKIDAISVPAPIPTQKDFPAELVEYNGKNFWKDLEELIKRISFINTALALQVRTGCLMRHEFYADTINNQVGIAQGALVLARGALGDALRLKTAVNVWK